MSQELCVSKFIVVANSLCLDFVNTQIIQGGELVDLLENFSDFACWLVAVQVLDPGEVKGVIKSWGNTSEGQHTFERALAFRLVLRRMVQQIVGGQGAPPEAMEEINKLLHYRIHSRELVQEQGRFITRTHTTFEEAVHLLTPIAEAASDLLVQADFSLIKKCENPECILYFYDTSKNRVRRWCSMSLCGNRMKAAAFYRRRRGSTTAN